MPQKSQLETSIYDVQVAARAFLQNHVPQPLPRAVKNPVEMGAVDAKPGANRFLVLLHHLKAIENLAVAFLVQFAQQALDVLADFRA